MSVITIAQANANAAAAGFTGHALSTIVAIAQAESGLDPTARHVNTDSHTFQDGHTGPSTDNGLVQINNYWHPEYTLAQADDPAEAMRAAWTISHSGTDFTPWSTYKSGAYLRFMPAVTTAPGGATVTTLPAGIPRNPAPLSQLHSPTKDGHPDEDASNNCGEDTLAWIARDIGNEPTCVSDEIHDEVIGQGVLGGSDLLDPADSARLNPKYVAAAAKRGVALTLYRGTQAELVARCHAVMNQPAGDVLINVGGGANYLHQFSDPAHYSGYGHICVVAHSISGGLELMDPWIGGWRSYTDAELEKMIVWGYIVVATPVPVSATTGGTTVGAPTGWTDNGAVLTTPGGAAGVGTGFRAFILDPKNGWDANDIPVGPETHVAEVELANTAHGAGTVQYFRYSALIWTQKDGVLRSWVGREAMTMRAQIATLDATRAKDAATIGAQSGQIATLTAQVTQLQAQVKNLTAQLAAAQNDVTTLEASNAALAKQLSATQSAATTPAPAPAVTPAPTTPAEAAALLVSLIYAQADATLKAASSAPTAG